MDVKTVSYKHPEAAAQFTQSLKETGFGVLSDHPIDQQLISDVFTEWEEFFASSDKDQYLFEKDTQAGFFPFKSENAKDAPQKDLKEFFHYYSWGPLPESCAKTKIYFEKMTALAAELLNWIEENSPEDVKSKYSQPLSSMIENSEQILLRPIHYPPLKDGEEPDAIRAAAHEDINLITLLPAATEPGLQVQDTQGNWHNVSCDRGTIAINAGDMLQEASGHYFPSTTHQVVNPEGPAARLARFSMPLFLHPRPEVTLSEKYTAGGYLDQRLKEIGLK